MCRNSINLGGAPRSAWGWLILLACVVFCLPRNGQAQGPESKPEPVKLRLTLKGHTDEVRAVQFAPGGAVLATGGWEGTLILWDATKGTKLVTIKEPGPWQTPIAFTPDGKTVIAGDNDGTVKMWDAATGKEKGELKGHPARIQLVTFLKDEKTLLTGDAKGMVRFWDITTGKKLAGRDAEVGPNLCLAITPDGKRLISTGTYDDARTLKVWDSTTQKLSATLKGHEGGIMALALTPDGKTLASSAHERGGPRERTATLWDLEAGKERVRLEGHTHDISAVVATADGKSLVTGSLDGTVKVWDVATGGERLTLEGEPYAGMIVSVCVSPDGKMVAAGWNQKTVTLWHLSQSVSSFVPKEVKAEKPRRPLTDEEWRALHAKAEALAGMGPKGVAALAKEVREGSTEWKVAALVALRNLGADAEPALASITPLLNSRDLELRQLAIGTLKAIGPKARSAIPALLEAAKETKDFTGSFSLGGSSNVAEAALEAVRAIDPAAMPRLAEAMIPGLLQVLEKGRVGASENALALLRQLGLHAKPALPKLKELLPTMRARSLQDVLPVFLGAGEEGMTLLADVIVDPKTSSEIKVGLMDGYRWHSETTPSAIRILRALLDDKNAKVRVAALTVLGSVRSKELIPAMVELLEDTELLNVPSDLKGDDEFHAARALGNQGKDAVPFLVKALGRRFHLVRFQAARALARMGKDAQEAVPALEKLLEDTYPVIQVEAAKAILKSGKVSDKAVKQIEDQLQGEPRLRAVTLEALGEVGRAGRPLFATVKRLVLESREGGVQRSGFRAIQAMQADSREIVQIWAVLVKKQPAFLDFPPTEHIRAHGKEALPALPALLDYLQDSDVNVRRRATEVLAAMGPAAEKAIPALIQSLEGDSWVADGATEALGNMGSLARPAVVPLLRRFEKIKADNREAAYERRKILSALEGIGPAAVEAVPRLLEWLPKTPAAARVLGRIGPEARAAVPLLEKMYRDETGYARAWSAFALVKITKKPEPYVSALLGVFHESKNPEQRREALRALIELGPDARAALPVFLKALKEKGRGGPFAREFDFQLEAATALVRFGPEAREAIPDLIDMVKTSYHAGKIAAAEALGAIGPAAKEAIPALQQMAEEDERFQPVVEKALEKIRSK